LSDLNSCSAIQPVNATVNPLPSVVATNDGPICSGSSFILNENGGNAVSWLWNTFGSAVINANTDQSPVVTGATNGDQFIVVVIDINGCTNSANTIISVVLSPILDPIADVVACDTFNLPVITGTNLTGNQSYYTDSQSNGGVPFTGPITSSQLVWVYDANGICSSNTNFNVTINPSPSVTNLIGGGTYCQGDQVNDITVDVTGSANWTINYTLDGVPQSASGTASPISLGTAPGVYELVDVSDANCTSTATGTETIVINPTPSAPVAGTDAEYCSTVSFVDMTASGGSGTFIWYSDPGLTTSIGTGSSLKPANTVGTTIYYVTETLNNCEGPSSQVIITVNECNVIIPTAFTPDGDLVNDEWEILELDKAYPNNQVYLYNRWGNLLFTSIKGAYNQNRWDGKYKGTLLPVGSYYYIIEFNSEDLDNNSETGTVSIILNK
jgi:gliding motility-associated-like protein